MIETLVAPLKLTFEASQPLALVPLLRLETANHADQHVDLGE